MLRITKNFFQTGNSEFHQTLLIICIGISLLKFVSIDCVAAVVMPPVAQEKIAFPPSKITGELADSGQMLSKSSQEQIGSIFSWIGTKGGYFRCERGIKNYGSGNSAGVTVSPEGKAMRSDIAKQSNSGGNQCAYDDSFYEDIAMVIVLCIPFLGFIGIRRRKKSNASVERRRKASDSE